MTYKELLLNYEEKQNKLKKEKDLIERLERKLAYHNKKVDKMQYDTCSRWNCIIYPLAEEIKSRCGFKYCGIYGPFGIEAQFSIYFANEGISRKTKRCDDSIDICKVETWCLDLKPSHDENVEYEYYTGEDDNTYESGSIGDLNGFNKKYKPLPTDIDEIIKLLVHTKGFR